MLLSERYQYDSSLSKPAKRRPHPLPNRLRTLLGQHFDVDPRHVHGYVIGEHGDSEVLVWSQTTIAGLSLDEFAKVQNKPLTAEHRQQIDEQVRRAAYHIIERKGATYYAVAAGLLRILEAILRDQATVLSVSSVLPPRYGLTDVSLSVPTVVTRNGIERVLYLPLDPEETAAFRRSGEVVQRTIASLDVDARRRD